MNKQVLKRILIFFLLSIVIELAVFNRDTFLSMGNGKDISLEYQAIEDFGANEQGKYELKSGQTGGFFLYGMDGGLSHVFFDIDCVDYMGEVVPYKLQMVVSDEGNAEPYYLPGVKIYSDVRKTKYISAHSYGDVENMRIYLSSDTDVIFSVRKIIYNATVPLEVSVIRVLLVFAGIIVLWFIRPGSSAYLKKWSGAEKTLCVVGIVVLNLLLWHWLISLNPSFMNPSWEHHKQYHKLAVAITQGKVSIPVGIEEEVANLENPYDYTVRNNTVANAYSGWDTAFYEGRFYVYFGIVPVLLFYLPYYVITGSAFQTWWGIFIMGAVLLVGVFYFLRQVVKRYFPDTPFLLYVILSVIAGNCMSTIMFMMRPDFYSLPLMCAMAFSVWGLGLWISAAQMWEKGEADERSSQRAFFVKLFAGSLCMALVAGCRPQFLPGSFLVFFIFFSCMKQEWAHNRSKLIWKAVVAVVPFIVVAIALMSYNFVRFGSPFDFGANYNLTTNDMTHRGFHMERATDGIFMYLFQFPNIGMDYPYVHSTSFHSSYIGKTIREAMFGGVLFTNPLLLALFMCKKVKRDLQKKGLFGMIVASIIFAIIIVIADTQLAGILSRYYADFLWLLLLAACLLILQVWESCKESKMRNSLVLFVLVCGIWGLFMQFGMGVQAGQLESKNAAMFYAIKAFWF